jgi:hypothetical protein
MTRESNTKVTRITLAIVIMITLCKIIVSQNHLISTSAPTFPTVRMQGLQNRSPNKITSIEGMWHPGYIVHIIHLIITCLPGVHFWAPSYTTQFIHGFFIQKGDCISITCILRLTQLLSNMQGKVIRLFR